MGIHHAFPYIVCSSLCSRLLLTFQLSLHLICCFLLSLCLLTGHLSHKLIFCPHSRPTNCKGNLAVRGNHSGLARDDPKSI
jgi:hypothetical protein